MSSLANIEDFLSYRRLAIIGVSRDPRDFSRKLYEEFRQRGYDVYPVNPSVREIDGQRCYDSVSSIESGVEAAIVMTNASASEAVVRDCAAAGVPRVWLYRAVGRGAVSPGAIQACEDLGISVVEGECPFMFLAGGAWIHGVHAFCRKLTGSYPI